MTFINTHYSELEQSYLFRTIDEKTTAYLNANPGAHLLRLGIGDVTLPLVPAVIEAMHKAVDDQATAANFHGYVPEVGYDFFREAVAAHYAEIAASGAEGAVTDDNDSGATAGASAPAPSATPEPTEIFASSGASDDLGDLLALFNPGTRAAVIEPAYPAYVDANVMSGNTVVHVPAGAECDFAPLPPADLQADVVYICSPNNPTGATYTREKLQAWVNWANSAGAVIIFDAAYEAFISNSDIPHTIYEIEGAKTCAIEVCSLSKTAGFTGTRCGYTIVPHALERNGMNLNSMWVRNRTTKTNGVSYVLQRAGAAALSAEGMAQCRENLEVYKQNGRVLMEALDATNTWYCGGQHAPYIWMKAPGGLSSWDFFDKLLQEAQIVGTPGSGFGSCGEGYFRLSMFGSAEDTREAAARLRKLL